MWKCRQSSCFENLTLSVWGYWKTENLQQSKNERKSLYFIPETCDVHVYIYSVSCCSVVNNVSMIRKIWKLFLMRLISAIAETLCAYREEDGIRRLERHVFSFISKSLDGVTSLMKAIIILSFWMIASLQYCGTLCKPCSITWDTLRSIQV